MGLLNNTSREIRGVFRAPVDPLRIRRAPSKTERVGSRSVAGRHATPPNCPDLFIGCVFPPESSPVQVTALAWPSPLPSTPAVSRLPCARDVPSHQGTRVRGTGQTKRPATWRRRRQQGNSRDLGKDGRPPAWALVARTRPSRGRPEKGCGKGLLRRPALPGCGGATTHTGAGSIPDRAAWSR
jgi:hypothetical protein